jgi:NADPH2:quinone reductase
MRAAYYEKNGAVRDVLMLGDLDTPKPAAGEVRVKLKTSGVNPSDVKSREGRTRKIAFPRVIPHSDGAGDIDMVGDGVPGSRIGERVWLWNGQWKRALGTCAEYIVVPANLAVPLPAHIDYEAGACLGIPAMTAWHAVEASGIGQGSTVLVTGGAGGVGHYAIQFSKARGATVLTTISGDTKALLARKAGADVCINYRTENVGAAVMASTGNRGVDAVIDMDFSSNAKLAPTVLHPRSKIVVYGNSQPEATIPSQFMLTNFISIHYIFVYELTADERKSAIQGITKMLESKALINNVARTFPLGDIHAAHEAVEQGTALGNVVVTI